MLSIRAMVRVGPWTFNGVDIAESRERCQRCGTSIRYVWLCEVEPEHSVGDLGGRTSWRIGSECGPQLMSMSDATWSEHASPIRSRLAVVLRLEALLSKAAEEHYELPAFIAERRAALLDGTLDDRLFRHLRGVMSGHERKLGLRK